MKKYFYILSILKIIIISCNASFAQKTDSLHKILATTKSDIKRIDLLSKLSEEYEKTDLLKAIQLNEQAIELAKKENLDSILPVLYNQKGSYFFYRGLYKQALVNFNIVLNLYIEQNNYDRIAMTYPNIGAIYHKIGDFQKANDTYRNSYKYMLENKNKFSKAVYNNVMNSLQNNMGGIQNELGNNREAINWYEKSLKIAEEMKSDDKQASVCHNLGKLFLEMAQYDSAALYLSRALIHRRAWGNKNSIALTLVVLADMYYLTNRPDSALVLVKEAYKLSLQTNSMERQLQCTRSMSNIYKKQKKFEEAYTIQEESIRLNDSLFSIAKTEEIYKVQLESELEAQRLELKIKEQKKITTFLILLSALIFIMAAIIVFYIIQRNKYKKLKLNQQILELSRSKLEAEIEIKNKELTTNVIYLIQKNEILSDIISRLFAAKESIKEENRPVIQKILQDLASLLDNNVWEEFEIRFQNVHSDFYKKLQEQFPDLTPNEKKLCAFLRLNMTTKEISAITNQNAKSIEMARHRLRKKLNLTNTQVNLVTFLMEL